MTHHPQHELVFTYGTLKRGFPNHPLMEEWNAAFIAEATTLRTYPLIVAGPWNVPFLFDAPDHPQGHHVEGELFTVDAAGLQALDRFEGVDRDYYARVSIDVRVRTADGNDRPATAWCYVRSGQMPEGLDDPARFLRSYGAAEVATYVPVDSRPADWTNDTDCL